MGSTVDISALWNDKTYSDLIIKCSSSTWYCHKNIVLPRSKTLQAAIEGIDSRGRTVLIAESQFLGAIACILRSMYQDTGLELFRGSDPDDIAVVFRCARHDGLFTLEEAAREAMLLFTQQLTSEVDAMKAVRSMYSMEDPSVDEHAKKIELKWMPKAMLNPETRSELSTGAIKRFFDSMEPRNKTDRFEYDDIEDHMRHMRSAAAQERKRKRRKL